MLSVVIPSYKDPYLHKTIRSALDNFRGEFEIVVVLDGYWPEEPIIEDPHIVQVHLGKNRGMRPAINAGVSVARGEFIMRTDEHCMFAPGFDTALTEICQDNWIMTAVRYYLDPMRWEKMDLPPVEYEKLVTQSAGNSKKFTGFPKPKPDGVGDIYESQAMQGSCWLMKRSWWDRVIGELQSEGYGTHLQDSHEMVFKTWKAGGKLMVNGKTWFAHKHVSFSRTHGLPPQTKELEYSYETWKDYYRELKRKKKI